LIGEGKVKIEHSEIERMEKGKAILKDGKALDADMVVYANGYFESKTPLEAIMGKKIAEENNEWMEKGNSFIIDPEGTSIATRVLEFQLTHVIQASSARTGALSRRLDFASSSSRSV
jgi:hypothetical protein